MSDFDWTPKPEVDNALGSPEEFDPTWPYNFKWGFDAQTRQAHVWRVQGGTDGRPVHRQELQQTWGRQPRVQDGDALGLAQYIPAEMKLDGTVVAPPAVLIQAYYKMDIPQEIFNWFEDNFPGSVARRAKLAAWEKKAEEEFDWSMMPDPDAGEEEITKWAYGDPEGLLMWDTDASQLPTHDQAATQAWGRKLQHGKDYWGYAVPADGRIEVETGRFDTPIKILQEVKGELSSKFPNQEVVLPVTQEDHEQLGVEFGHNDPKMHVDHAVSASWAQDHLGLAPRVPLDGPVTASKAFPDQNRVVAPDSYFKTLQRFLAKNVFPTRKVADADMEGAMIAVFLPKDVGEKIKIEGGEPVSNMHITLVYFTDKAADRDDWDEVERITEQYAQKYPVLKGEIGGYGVFSNNEPVLWASPSVPQLAELRHELAEACREAGFNVSDEYGWAPHITLAYDWDDDLPKLDEKLPVTFKTLRFARGNDGTDYKFTGTLSKTAGPSEWGSADFEANSPWVDKWKDGSNMPFGPQTWSGWKDAHRFITDGKDVLSEPEENLRWRGKGWHGNGHPGLESDFYDTHPDSEGVSGGWAVPTIDGGGYGAHMWGWGDKPQDALAALEKHLGKPVHLTDMDNLQNPKVYQQYPEGGWYVGFANGTPSSQTTSAT